MILTGEKVQYSEKNLGVDIACNRNKYQGYLMGGKVGRCLGLTTLPSACPDGLEILGSSTSWSPQGMSRPIVRLLLTFRFTPRKTLQPTQLFSRFACLYPKESKCSKWRGSNFIDK
jgi:hypothetical protein